MVLLQEQVGALERSPVLKTLETDLFEKGSEKARGRAKSSLVVIENPSLNDYLGILMVKTTVIADSTKAFLDVYLLEADRNYEVDTFEKIKQAKSKPRSGSPPYIITFDDGSTYGVASLLPHEICNITDEEFRKYETSINADNGLDAVVRDMAQLLGERVKSFSFEGGKLVLPVEYASMNYPS
jgi:hypothetical protein